MPKKLSKEQTTEIIQLYQSGETPKVIGEKFGIRNNSVTRLLKKNNIPRIQHIEVPQDEIDKIIDMYVNKEMSSEDIAPLININSSTILRILERNKIERRPSTRNKRLYDINENYFETIDTEYKAYFLGFLYADGNLSHNLDNKKRNAIRIYINKKDIEILEAFSKEIYGFIKVDIDFRKEINDYNIFSAVYSEKMHSDLCKLGCTPNKTFIITFPTSDIVPEHLIWHFIRGYFDGDGCLSLADPDRPILDFTSNIAFIEGLIKFFNTTLNIECNKPYNRKDRDNSSHIQFGDLKKRQLVLDHMYKDATIFLKRKKNNYDEVCKMYNEQAI